MHFVFYRYCCEGQWAVKWPEKSGNLIMTGEWPPSGYTVNHFVSCKYDKCDTIIHQS